MPYHWSIDRLTDFLARVSTPQDDSAAVAVALERAVVALAAQVAAVVIGETVAGAVGLPTSTAPAGFITAANGQHVVLSGLGATHIAVGDLHAAGSRTGGPGARLVVGRLGPAFTPEESHLLEGMALVLGLVLHNLSSLQVERRRHRLVETLLEIQHSISARRPLPELLDAITAGASGLLGDCAVALLLTDAERPGKLEPPASHRGFPVLDPAALEVVRRVLTVPGVPAPRPAPDRAADRAPQGVLAERVVVGGETAGCLVARPCADHVHGRQAGEMLTAFAQQVSLALTDARTRDAVREAHHDPITALPNRALFLERLEQQRRTCLNDSTALTVLFIDLDRFKAVNDTLGHKAGDELLSEVAHRILTCIHPDDTAARIGGDEFSVLVHHADTEMGSAVARRIIAALTSPFVIAGREVLIGASVGIAPLTWAQQDASALLSDADVAMYCAKRAGRGRFVVFEPRMHEEVANHLSLRTELRNARANGQLTLLYQPIIAIGHATIDGVEALMRWSHPTRGMVSPAEFIPIAEESDAILSLGAWAVGEAVGTAARWRTRMPSLQLSLNISGRQVVDPHLAVLLSEALREWNFPAEALTLEITESVLMSDPELARVRLRALKDLGARLAIDDFGTGYSSLSYLRQFPVDQVKIDRSFITGLRYGADDDIAVVRCILDLCQSLRLQTVAEGIESPEQLRILAGLGCDLAQGYLFGAPLAPDQILEQFGAGALSPR